MIRTLALDTSTKFLSLACFEDDNVVSELHEDAGISHSEILVSRISDMLKSAGWGTRDIALTALGIGPGSFTGLRIGTALVKGLAMVSDMKIAGVPTLDAIACRAPAGSGLVVPVLDAHKGKVYSCVYERRPDGMPLRKTDYLLCEVGELAGYVNENAVFFGNGLNKYAEDISKIPGAVLEKNVDWYPRATDVGRIGMELARTTTYTPESIDPMYLHPKECNVLPGKVKAASSDKTRNRE